MAVIQQKIEYVLTLTKDEVVLILAGLRILRIPQTNQTKKTVHDAETLQTRIVDELRTGLLSTLAAADAYRDEVKSESENNS